MSEQEVIAKEAENVSEETTEKVEEVSEKVEEKVEEVKEKPKISPLKMALGFKPKAPKPEPGQVVDVLVSGWCSKSVVSNSRFSTPSFAKKKRYYVLVNDAIMFFGKTIAKVTTTTEPLGKIELSNIVSAVVNGKGFDLVVSEDDGKTMVSYHVLSPKANDWVEKLYELGVAKPEPKPVEAAEEEVAEGEKDTPKEGDEAPTTPQKVKAIIEANAEALNENISDIPTFEVPVAEAVANDEAEDKEQMCSWLFFCF